MDKNTMEEELHAVYESSIEMGDRKIRVYITSDGKRLIDKNDLDELFVAILEEEEQ